MPIILTSLLVDKNYNSNITCNWVIPMLDKHSFLRFHFLEFELCEGEVLSFWKISNYSSTELQLIQQFDSSYDLPDAFDVRSSVMITFVDKNSNNHFGKFSLQFIKISERFGGEYIWIASICLGSVVTAISLLFFLVLQGKAEKPFHYSFLIGQHEYTKRYLLNGNYFLTLMQMVCIPFHFSVLELKILSLYYI